LWTRVVRQWAHLVGAIALPCLKNARFSNKVSALVPRLVPGQPSRAPYARASRQSRWYWRTMASRARPPTRAEGRLATDLRAQHRIAREHFQQPSPHVSRQETTDGKVKRPRPKLTKPYGRSRSAPGDADFSEGSATRHLSGVGIVGNRSATRTALEAARQPKASAGVLEWQSPRADSVALGAGVVDGSRRRPRAGPR
jgi:hypothetical protein